MNLFLLSVFYDAPAQNSAGDAPGINYKKPYGTKHSNETHVAMNVSC